MPFPRRSRVPDQAAQDRGVTALEHELREERGLGQAGQVDRLVRAVGDQAEPGEPLGTAAPLDGPDRNSFWGMTVRIDLVASLTMRGTTKSWKPTSSWATSRLPSARLQAAELVRRGPDFRVADRLTDEDRGLGVVHHGQRRLLDQAGEPVVLERRKPCSSRSWSGTAARRGP